MSDDATEFDYPVDWTPRGAEPPRRPYYAPKMRSGLGVTGDEQPDEPHAYPESWGYRP
jgi:hypothetical protein